MRSKPLIRSALGGSLSVACAVPKLAGAGVSTVGRGLGRAAGAVWKQACTDINAAGASFIIHGSIATVAGIFFLFSLKAHRRARFIKAVDVTNALTWGEADAASRRRELLVGIMGDELPPWVHFPDWEKAPFIQAALEAAWPGLNAQLTEIIRNQIENNFGSYENWGCIKVDRLDFGLRPITVAGCKVSKNSSAASGGMIDDLVLQLHLKWAGQPDVRLSFPNFTRLTSIGMSYLHFSGVFKVNVTGISNRPPFLSGLNISLMKNPKPKLDFGLHALGFMGDALMAGIREFTPWVHEKIHSAILSPITDGIPIQIQGGNGGASSRPASPLGVLEIVVVRGVLSPRTGFLGRSRQVHPRVSLLLPKAEDPAACAVTQGVFTKVDGSDGRHPEWGQTFHLVVTSRQQSLQLLLSHKRNLMAPGAQLEPMGWDKPLGSATMALCDILPEEEYFSCEEDAMIVVCGQCDDNILIADLDAVDAAEQEQQAETAAAEEHRLGLPSSRIQNGVIDLGDRWVEFKPTNLAAMEPAVNEALKKEGKVTILRSPSVKSKNPGSDASATWLDAVQDRILDPSGRQAFDSWDWAEAPTDSAGKVMLRLRWLPTPDTAAHASENEPASQTPLATKIPLQGANPPRSTTTSSTLEIGRRNMSVMRGSAADLAHSRLASFKLADFEEETGNAAFSRSPLLLRQLGKSCTMAVGVLAVHVEKSKQYFGKLPDRQTTMAVSLVRPKLAAGAPDNAAGRVPLPPTLVSLSSRRSNQHGGLEWKQTFYLPVFLPRAELESGELSVRVELGNACMHSGALGKWVKGRSGPDIFALDAFDSYSADVRVIGRGQIPLRDVMKAGKAGVDDKVVLAEPEKAERRMFGMLMGNSRETRRLMNLGKVKLHATWIDHGGE